ncbi:ankyrin repeat domain-containing protein 31 isoform X2 [Erinaceus europaeus]|uniref:Ankyrin repeat domain-containing protein 31 isoform X2 n=1 Tax=Erinaceus europaeus TaxID=9365 RepID=A0ABM3Y7H8_ERIEU|nr:ankyrin repeat domain-containing protein 31 isoform X2 [Erinaceus europaeus]
MCPGVLSPEIQLGFKLRQGPQGQMSNNELMPAVGEDEFLQPQDEGEENQALWTKKSCSRSLATVLFPQAEGSRTHQNFQGPEAENSNAVTPPDKERSEDRSSPEISLLSGIITVPGVVSSEDKLSVDSEKTATTPNNVSEPGQEVAATMTRKERKGEESSLETFVSAIDRLLPSPEIVQEEGLFEIMSDFEAGELLDTLSCSLSSMSMSLEGHRDLLANAADCLPDELLAALNTLSEDGAEPVCPSREGDGALRAGGECSGEGPCADHTDDYTQIAEMIFESLCSVPLLEQDSKAAEPQNKRQSTQQTVEDPHPLGSQTLQQPSSISCDPANNEGTSGLLGNSSVQAAPCVLRRSSRLKADRQTQYTDDLCTGPESTWPNRPVCERRTKSSSATEKSRIQDPAVMTESKGKSVRSSRPQVRKNKRSTGRKAQMKMNNIPLSCINRRNAFGENLLYKAAVHDDVDLIKLCIKKGGNVNQQSYAGWTPLHEACVGGFYQVVSELLEGGADVNIRGMHQITPLHDAVKNGHYKVAKLLLVKGADPSLRSENGGCALDETQDSSMRRLLQRYLPERGELRGAGAAAQNSNSDQLDVEDAHQHKKPKFSSKNGTGFPCDKNSNRQKTAYAEVGKESEETFPTDQVIYEYCKEDSQDTRARKPKPKQSALKQRRSARLRKDTLQTVNSLNRKVSNDKERRGTLHESTQVGETAQESHPRKTRADSSSRKTDGRITHQQGVLQTHGLPEESYDSPSPPLSNLQSMSGSNTETHLTPKKTRGQKPDVSGSQEVKWSGLQSVDQPEVVSFPGLCSHHEMELVDTSAGQQPRTPQKLEQVKPDTFHKNRKSGGKAKNLNKWETSFLSFIKDNVNDAAAADDDGGDSYTCEETVPAEKMACSVASKNSYTCDETVTNRKDVGLQQYLPSEDQFSQESQLKADSPAILPQQEAAHFAESVSTVVSGQHNAVSEQYAEQPSFDHSLDNSELTSLAPTRVLSAQEVSKSNNRQELLKKTQDDSSRAPTSLMSQTDTLALGKVRRNEETHRSCTDKDQQARSPDELLHTVVYPHVVETTEADKRKQGFPGSHITHDRDLPPIDTADKESTDISQHRQRAEAEVSHNPEMKTAGVNKRMAKGESRLHLAARRGDVALPRTLLESGADVNQGENAGWTPLHEASSKGFSDITAELLKSGAGVNCENPDGILALHDTAANSHLQATEILLQHGASPSQKNEEQRTAVDEARDEAVKELLTSHGAVKVAGREERSAAAAGAGAVKIPTARSKRKKKQCDDCRPAASPGLEHQGETQQARPGHQTISDILQDIEEKQEHLLQFEIRSPEDADQYIEKMLMIKEVMDNVLAKQKVERDDLAKKYRVSIESFKHGVLREQLASLASRQKNLLVVARKQKEVSLKIQNYKNVMSTSGLGLKKLPPSSGIAAEDSHAFASLENPAQPRCPGLSPLSQVCGSTQETQLSLEMWRDSQNANIGLRAETEGREELPGSEQSSKQHVKNRTWDELSKSSQLDDTTKAESPSQPVALFANTGCSEIKSNPVETTPEGPQLYSPSAVAGILNVSETTGVLAPKTAHQAAAVCDGALSADDPVRESRKAASQEQARMASESQAGRNTAVLGREMWQQSKPGLKKPAFAIPQTYDNQSASSSGSDSQHTAKKPLTCSSAPKKKCVQLKDLISLGRVSPGSNILEFKTQETTHKASVLLSGRIKAESGQVYQNPVAWVKDLLGGSSHVTWNYAWSKVTYLGKELLKYTSEEVPTPPEPNLAPQHQSCLSGASQETVQSVPHYLQIKEILLSDDQEYLPPHIMDRHWKFYVECEQLTF